MFKETNLLLFCVNWEILTFLANVYLPLFVDLAHPDGYITYRFLLDLPIYIKWLPFS